MNTKMLAPVKSCCRCPQSCINHRACDRPDFSRLSKYCCVCKHVRLDLIEVPRLESVSSVCAVARCHRCELGVDETVAAIASAAEEKGFAEPALFIATLGDGARRLV